MLPFAGEEPQQKQPTIMVPILCIQLIQPLSIFRNYKPNFRKLGLR